MSSKFKQLNGSVNEFSVYKVSKEWQYNPIIVSDFPAHERETNFRSQLTRCNVDNRIFAHFNRKENQFTGLLI